MKPCSSCPFRADAQVGLWEPAHYLLIAYLGSLSDPVPAVFGMTMGCHKYNEVLQPGFRGQPPMCTGWLLAAPDAQSIRFAAILGRLSPEEQAAVFGAARSTEVLSPEEMLRVNGFDMDRIPPRSWSKNDPRYPTFDAWAGEVTALATKLRRRPATAWEYVLPGSPLHRGVSPEQVEQALGPAAARRYTKRGKKP